ncbi:SixA phosphatase family protein [Streptomyces sclerotialus]|uniref:SixA phosphatase family protein n=1 Tax=Streptomyces sclerotialus TaxID=1957 RepID=UPI0004CC69CD
MTTTALRRLLLLRHAEAARPPGTPDHERPLSPRGRRDATAAGRLLTEADRLPGLVWRSTSRRTRETWELAAAGPGSLCSVRYEPRLHRPPLPDLLAMVREAPAHIGTLLLVGHNPSPRDAILATAGDGVGSELRTVQDKFPTAAIALLTWGGRWQEIDSGTTLLTGTAVARGPR